MKLCSYRTTNKNEDRFAVILFIYRPRPQSIEIMWITASVYELYLMLHQKKYFRVAL